MRTLALGALLIGCWRGQPASAPVTTKVAEPVANARALAADLAVELRDPSDDMSPAQYIDGAVLVLDLDRKTRMTWCDAQALGAALAWGDLLTDPDRPPPMCRRSAEHLFVCRQAAGPQHDLLIMSFQRADPWRLVGVVIGSQASYDRSLVDTFDADLARFRGGECTE